MKISFVIVIVFAAGVLSFGALAQEDAPRSLYATENVYEVWQNGELAGEHVIRFDDGDGGRLTVVARTRASVSFYGLFDVPFEYDSLALWQGGELISITASYLRGFVRGESLARGEGDFYTTGKGENINAPLFPTNHWHNGVLKQTRVFNTLGGNISTITITPDINLATINIGGKMRVVRGYGYDGDLQLISWYDTNGRWIKMRFDALGGVFEFVCRLCDNPNPELQQ